MPDPYGRDSRNRKTVRAAKKRIDRTFRTYLADGVTDGSIKPCDPKLAAFAIAGSLNWIGHWYQRDRAWSGEAVAGQFAVQLTEGLAASPARKRSPVTSKSRPAKGGRK